MLKQLKIHNFALVKKISVDFSPGMTVITGETGAGKSMLLDALELTLGSRADPNLVRDPEHRAELIAHFDLRHNQAARDWLSHEELDTDDLNQCVLRRTIRSDGRSKAYINGYAVPLVKIKQLAYCLINLYGQHEHQHLLKREAHRDLVDKFANHKNLLEALEGIYKEWHQCKKLLQQLLTQDQNQSRQNLLQYQVEELDSLGLGQDEYSKLLQEHKQLSQLDTLVFDSKKSLDLIQGEGDFNITSGLSECLHALEHHAETYEPLHPIIEMLNAALIQLQEAETELSHFLEAQELNPERLQYIENRLDKISDIARKHHIKPQALGEYHTNIRHELDMLAGSEEKISELKASLLTLEESYQSLALTLRRSRENAAEKLAKHVTKQIKQLGMPEGQFEVHFTCHDITELNPHGTETIEFMISTNPGRPLQPLHRVASGGELSRIALGIQVITAQTEGTQTLVFDEIDVGVGGGTAEIVGKLLRKLGNQAQVICITHQPQVAATGHHHLKVEKRTNGKVTESFIDYLMDERRVSEIARMLGGIEITQKTLQHACEMLQLSLE